MSKKFKQDPQNYFHKVRGLEGKRALFKFTGGNVRGGRIIKVESNRPAFFVLFDGETEEELILGGVLSVKPLNEDSECVAKIIPSNGKTGMKDYRG